METCSPAGHRASLSPAIAVWKEPEALCQEAGVTLFPETCVFKMRPQTQLALKS